MRVILVMTANREFSHVTVTTLSLHLMAALDSWPLRLQLVELLTLCL